MTFAVSRPSYYLSLIAAIAIAIACALLHLPSPAFAQAVSAPAPIQEELRQQERQKALRDSQEKSVDARLPTGATPETRRLPDSESPCFRMDRVLLVGERSESFQWALASLPGSDRSSPDSPVGRCLGATGVTVVLSRLQQAVIARGYITTRVLAAPQDLSAGTLTVTLVPGRIAAIRFAPGSTPSSPSLLASAIPAHVGDLLNLRDIEQGLENLKRVPSADASIQIEPSAGSSGSGARPGDSDLVVKYTQARHLRGALGLDDSGLTATGRYQGSVTVAADNLLGLNDLFYISANHSVGNHFLGDPGTGTEGQTVHYSLPWGDWLLGTTLSNSRFAQTVAGFSQNYVFSGQTRNGEIKLARLIYRDQSRKTTTSLKVFRRDSRSFIEDVEVQVQHRVEAGWEAGLQHKEFMGRATLEGNLNYRRGTGALGAITAPEELFNEGTSRFKLVTADASLNAPFRLAGQQFRYAGLWRAQWNSTPLTPLDQFAIGGRYTVRGFDGETSLLAERGWLIRNDLGWAVGQSGAEAYMGIDYGHVAGPSARWLQAGHLTGGVIGVRGALNAFRGLNYDVFVGAPIWKPLGYRTASVTSGFSVVYNF